MRNVYMLIGAAVGYGVTLAFGLDVPPEAFAFFGFGSSSDSRTSSETTNEQNIRTYNLSDLEGTTIADSEDVEIQTQIEQVDEGLVDAARDISLEAFDTTRSIADDSNAIQGQAIRANENVVLSGLDYGQDALEDALMFGARNVDAVLERSSDSEETVSDFGQAAIDEISRANQISVDTVADVARGSQSRAFDFAGRALTGVEETTRATTESLGNAITQAAQATRSDASNVVNNVVKYGAIALGIGLVAYAVTRSS